MNLKKMRKKSKMTQSEAAKLLNVSQSTISLWEKEKNFPKIQMLPCIARVYNCKINDLFSEE